MKRVALNFSVAGYVITDVLILVRTETGLLMAYTETDQRHVYLPSAIDEHAERGIADAALQWLRHKLDFERGRHAD